MAYFFLWKSGKTKDLDVVIYMLPAIQMALSDRNFYSAATEGLLDLFYLL